jgi:GNAT superfamily N-acetyltransferase
MTSLPDGLTIANGGPKHAAILLALLDEAIAWLVARGETGQWGSDAFSARPAGVAQAQRLAAGGGLRIGYLDGEPVAALVVGKAPEYVPVADRRELYIQLLLTSRHRAGQQLGDRLIERAIAEARQDDCQQLRVDCWAGAPELVAWYERHGFTRTGTFELEGWTGQIFAMPLA